MGHHAKAKEPSLPYYLLIARRGEQINSCLFQGEMHLPDPSTIDKMWCKFNF